MTNTTLAAILTALETTIGNLDPAGGESYGEVDAYGKVNDEYYEGDPETLEEADIDRQFALVDVTDEVDVQGGSTTNIHLGIFQLHIGHKQDNFSGSRTRRIKDSTQLAHQLIKESNRPSGVNFIAYRGSTVELVREGKWWWTVLTFEISYNVSSNYGG